MLNSKSKELSEKSVDKDPIVQFKFWYKQVTDENISMPEAMILATATLKGIPSLRTVLLKTLDEIGSSQFSEMRNRG